jgi:uncharacterized membrane protein
MLSALPRWIPRSAAVLACAWPLLLHAAILSGRPEWAPAITVLSAMLGLILWALAMHRLQAVLLAIAMAAGLALVVAIAPRIVLYAPSFLINVALAAVFGMSLQTRRVPVITRFAMLEQGALAPDLASYTRRLTWVWAVFFSAMAATSIALAVFGSLAAWSTFSNVVNYVLVCVLFVGEYLYRRRRFRQYDHASLIDLVRNVRRAGVKLERPVP